MDTTRIWFLRFYCLSLLLIISFAPFQIQAATEISRNGELALVEGKLNNWKVFPVTTAIAAETANLPPNVSRGICITVGEPDRIEGQLVQRLSVPSGITKLKVRAFLKSELVKTAYVQIKFFQKREEIKDRRLKVGKPSEIEWKQVEAEFETQGADKIEIIYRWSQTDATKGTRIWLADVHLTDIAE